MQTWKNLYGELAEKLTQNIEKIKWIDLWHNQVGFLEDEHPFPTPAVFFAFRSGNIIDASDRVQQIHLQVDVYLYYETFADTYTGSFNQVDALEFLELLDKLQQQLHGSSGENYSNMRRVAFSPVDTGGAGNLYLITFSCELVDETAQPEWQETKGFEVQVEHFTIEI